MKKLVFILTCMLSLHTVIVRADNEKPIQVTQLPVAAQGVIKQHFADHQVTLAKVESELLSKNYKVIFTNGNHIEFDSKGNWEEVDCKFSSVPAAIIPTPIMEYITKNYPNVTVKKIEKDRKEYEVKLSNRIELSFDLKFNLIDIDM
ncbi:MAG: PepSY-like domain-containing protein [Odoribacter sp.]|nr:PepSY-like domain-containing protein [Odoribacter sp.]